ncbi:MAG: hypothetical protein RJB66_2750 [Pseudomonadota bacterium]|jgi:cobalt-zinc-cadmium efflux system protein
MGMSHNHTHSHGHASHAPHDGAHHHGDHHHHHHHAKEGKFSALIIAFLLNFGFCVVEALGGFYASSQAVMADALHDFGDSLSLLLLITLRWMASRPAGEVYSFGYRRLNIIGASIVGLSLMVGCIIILGSSLPLVLNPHPVNGPLMMALAVVGVTVNGFAFYRLRSQGGVGERLVSLHLLEDLWGWVIVFIGAIAIYLYSWYWLDPLLSVFLAFYILWQSFGQMKVIGRLLMLGSSSHFSVSKVSALLGEVEGVKGVHHVHVWELDQGFHIATAHLVVAEGAPISVVKQKSRSLLQSLGPCELTIEIEQEGEICLDPVHPADS